MERPRKWPRSPAITADDVPRIAVEHRVVVIHCWAVWNGYDLSMDRTIQEVRPRYPDRIAFYALDIDLQANHAWCQQYNVLNVPVLVCFLNGTWHETSHGVSGKPLLEARLDAWLAAADAR